MSAVTDRFVRVRCPICMKFRYVTKEYSRKIKDRPVCQDCARNNAVMARKTRRCPELLRNGCRLMPCSSTALDHVQTRRCSQFMTCPNYESCLDAVAELDWPGWKAEVATC